MFTGLVELIGRVTEVVQHDASSGSFAIKIGDTAPILGDCHIGDSIAVNGVCLTVTRFSLEQGGWFNVDVAPETLFRTNLGHVKPGDGVNCERAMAPHTRFGGHIVQGHIDTVATLESIVPNESARTLTLRLVYEKPEEGKPTLPLPSTLSPYVIPKGFITLDGASLTLIDVSPPNGGTLDGQTSDIPTKETIEFTVMLIPHTQEHITLPSKPNGARVNVEFDMVGKPRRRVDDAHSRG
ncbi:Rib5p [Malassezia vespertilionis]|uniref:Rib5p n=1 Tax=Malassezia vespertilionis TaxID=2020962 RepID=A0A2N1JGW2_9BASI|nr:Rib5p [Malassezia vespertilionis]